ncbi:ATP-binding cassette domain-containing protein [Angustibacter speluncae]
MNAALRVVAVTHGRRERDRPVLDDVSLEVARGEVVALVGRSGSGKSTLCQLAAGLERPDTGTVEVDGRPSVPAADWGVVAFQPQRLALAGELSVAENALLPCRLAGVEPPPDLLAVLDVAHLAARSAGLTSLGEQQRTGIARALCRRPVLALLDEPTGHQDDEHVQAVLAALGAASAAGSALLVATHDPRVVAVADRAVHLEGGRVVPPTPADAPATRP